MVRLYEEKKIPLFCKNHNTLSHLEFDCKQRLILVDVRFEIEEYHLGDILGYLPVLAVGSIWSRDAFRPIAR